MPHAVEASDSAKYRRKLQTEGDFNDAGRARRASRANACAVQGRVEFPTARHGGGRVLWLGWPDGMMLSTPPLASHVAGDWPCPGFHWRQCPMTVMAVIMGAATRDLTGRFAERNSLQPAMLQCNL